jgi:hypothetical protein
MEEVKVKIFNEKYWTIKDDIYKLEDCPYNLPPII